jgi:O-antigen/teichoic acid export membrane protein
MLDKIFAKIEKFVPARWRWILSHEGFKKYFRNTGWMFAGQIFSLVGSFFIGVWVARYLGPQNYGIINYAAAFAGIFSCIAGLGVDGVVTRDLVKNPEQEKELMGTGLALKMLGGTLAFLIALAADYLVSGTPLTHFLIFLYALGFFIAPFSIISLYFQAKVQAKNSVRAQMAALIISSALKILFIFSGLSIIWLVVVYVLDALWQVIWLWSTYRRTGHRFAVWAFDRQIAKRLWHDGWPLMLSGAAAYIYLRIDQVMIGRMLGTVEVGLYAAAVKITEIWYFLPGIICGSLFPAIVNAKKTDENLYRRRLRNLYWLMVSVSIVIALPISLLAKPIILFLFGSRYLLSASILQIYIWSGVGLFLGWAVNQYLMAENRTRLIFLANLAATVANVGLNFWLIPTIGLYGAALATLISYFVIPLTVLVVRKIEKK